VRRGMADRCITVKEVWRKLHNEFYNLYSVVQSV
jgi:hypothetical protein